MLTTSTSFGTWVLISIPYLIDGALLAAIYHLSKKNVYASIAAHMLNNLVAVILVFI
jgi:membrane protease YdiL (CAAX protease family)